MTKAERDLLMSVAAAIASMANGWGGDLTDAERVELSTLAGVEVGSRIPADLLAKMRAVAAEQA